MEYAILDEVRRYGVNAIESCFGSLADYICSEWGVEPRESNRVANWIERHI